MPDPILCRVSSHENSKWCSAIGKSSHSQCYRCFWQLGECVRGAEEVVFNPRIYPSLDMVYSIARPHRLVQWCWYNGCIIGWFCLYHLRSLDGLTATHIQMGAPTENDSSSNRGEQTRMFCCVWCPIVFVNQTSKNCHKPVFLNSNSFKTQLPCKPGLWRWCSDRFRPQWS